VVGATVLFPHSSSATMWKEQEITTRLLQGTYMLEVFDDGLN